MSRASAPREPVEHAARAPFHSGAIAPCMHGRNTSPSAPGGTRPLPREEVVGVAEPLGLGPPLDRRELVAPPPQVAARDEPGVLEQPRVGVGVRMAFDEHRRILAVRSTRRRPAPPSRRRRTPPPAGTRRRRASPPSRPRTRPRRSSLDPAGGLRERRRDRRDRLRRADDLGEHRLGHVDGREHLGRPRTRAGVQERERGRVRVIDGNGTRDLAERVRPGRHQRGRLRPHLRLLVADPEGLEDRVRGVEVRADVPVERLGRHPLGDGRGLGLGATVHPDHRRTQWASLRVAHHHPIQLRPERQPLDGGRALGHLVEQLSDAGHDRGRPRVWVLLGGAGERERQVVGLVRGGDERPVRRIQRAVRPLRTDVAADHVRTRHGRMTVFRPDPERIVSNACAISSRGNRCVTTRARSSCRRSR